MSLRETNGVVMIDTGLRNHAHRIPKSTAAGVGIVEVLIWFYVHLLASLFTILKLLS